MVSRRPPKRFRAESYRILRQRRSAVAAATYLFDAENQDRAEQKKHRGYAKRRFDVECAPQRADKKAGAKIAECVYRGQRSEGHSVLLLRSASGGDRVFQCILRAFKRPGEWENHGEQDQRLGSCAKKEGGQDRDAIAAGEDEFSLRQVIREPTADIRRARREKIVERIERDGERRSAGQTVSRNEHAGGVKNQERVREVARAEHPDAEEELSEFVWQRPDADQKRLLFATLDRALAHEKQKAERGDEPRHERPKKYLAKIVPGFFKKPERGNRSCNRADGVHQPFEAEGAAVRPRRSIRGKQRFFCRRAHTAAKPANGARDNELVRMSRERECGSRNRRHRISENGNWFSFFPAIGVVACRELCKAGEAVGDSFDRAEPRRAGADDRKKRRKNRRCGFVAPIGKEGSQADAEDSSVEPGFSFGGVGHLFFCGAIENDADFFERHESAADHLVQPRQNCFNLFRRFNHFHHDRQVLRQTENFIRVVSACAAVAAHAAQYSRSRKSFAAQQLDNRFVERFAVPFVGFTDVNPHQRSFAFKLFMSHGALPQILKTIRQANSRDGKQKAREHAGANIRRSAQPFAILQHFCGFPTETGKRGVAAEKTDGDRDAPVRRNHHAVQSELTDEAEKKASAEIDQQRAIRKRTAHAKLHDSLKSVSRKRADGAEECNQENVQRVTPPEIVYVQRHRGEAGNLCRLKVETIANAAGKFARVIPVGSAEGIGIVDLIAGIGDILRGETDRQFLAKRFSERNRTFRVIGKMLRS